MIKAIVKYLLTTIRHKYYVWWAGKNIVGGIPLWQLLVHDLSKFNPIEFVNYARYYIYSDRKDRDAFLKAWMHHQKRNPHHPEYWTTVGIYDWSNGALPMPMIYVREWVADLLGASREYTGSWEIEAWVNENGWRWAFCDPVTIYRLNRVLRSIGVVPTIISIKVDLNFPDGFGEIITSDTKLETKQIAI